MPSVSYRISRFGTVLLTPEQQYSSFLVLRISCVLTRALEYPNRRFIPPQNNWLYWVGLSKDGYSVMDGYARWYKQQWLLWNYAIAPTNNALCQIGNTLYSELMTELAKKPNIPPLPPSVPPLSNPFSLIGRFQVPSVSAITFSAFNDGDFDVSLDWQDPPPQSECSPAPVDLPPPAPISPQLPPPGVNMPAPPPESALQPPSAPTGSPASGASLVPPGFPPGYQSQPPNTRSFKWRIGRTGSSYVSNCSPTGGTRSPLWPTPPGQFAPSFLGSLVATESLLGTASARPNGTRNCSTPGGRVLEGYDFRLNGVTVDANGAMQTYVLANYKIYDDNGEWELFRVQASGSQ